MNGELHSRKRLATIAAACLLTVALPAGTAMAQKVKTKAAEPAASQVAPTQFTVEIPTIEAVDANVDEGTLRDIFSGNVADNASALAGLSATSITIPEMTVSFTNAQGEGASEGTFTLSDYRPQRCRLTALPPRSPLPASNSKPVTTSSARLGASSANEFDIGGVLGALWPGARMPARPNWRNHLQGFLLRRRHRDHRRGRMHHRLDDARPNSRPARSSTASAI